MKNIKEYRSYIIIIFVFALVGMLFSLSAQRGGINQLNGFIAPIMGPWSRILEPNGDKLKYWEMSNYVFAISVSFVAVVSVAMSSIPKHRLLRILTKLIAHTAVVFWCLCGLGKVIVELR